MRAFTPLLAEVADKEPTLALLWSIAGVLSVLGYFLCRWCKSAAALVVVCAVVWAYGMITELQDSHVSPAIQRELGRGYIAQAYVAALIPLAIMGVAFWIRSRKHNAA